MVLASRAPVQARRALRGAPDGVRASGAPRSRWRHFSRRSARASPTPFLRRARARPPRRACRRRPTVESKVEPQPRTSTRAPARHSPRRCGCVSASHGRLSRTRSAGSSSGRSSCLATMHKSRPRWVRPLAIPVLPVPVLKPRTKPKNTANNPHPDQRERLSGGRCATLHHRARRAPLALSTQSRATRCRSPHTSRSRSRSSVVDGRVASLSTSRAQAARNSQREPTTRPTIFDTSNEFC